MSSKGEITTINPTKKNRNKGSIPFRTSAQKRELYDLLLEKISNDVGFEITSASFLKPVFDTAFISECEKRGYDDLKTQFLSLDNIKLDSEKHL